MIFSRPAAIAIPAVALLLAGCAGSISSYPSLAPRAVEKTDAMADPAAPAAGAVTALPSGITARAAELVGQGQAGDAAFAKAARDACEAIDRGRAAASGSEAWVRAQTALSTIEAERHATTMALDDANQLVLDQARLAQDSAQPVDLTPLTTAAATLSALDAAQAGRLAAIRERGCRP